MEKTKGLESASLRDHRIWDVRATKATWVQPDGRETTLDVAPVTA